MNQPYKVSKGIVGRGMRMDTAGRNGFFSQIEML